MRDRLGGKLTRHVGPCCEVDGGGSVGGVTIGRHRSAIPAISLHLN